MSLVAQVTVTCVSSQSTFMYIRNDPNSVNYYRNVHFYNDTFQRLYNCMKEVDTTQCSMKMKLLSSLPPASLPQGYDGNDFIVQDVTTFHGSHEGRGYFTCQFDLSVSVLECTRSTTNQCEGDLCKSFRRRSSPPICDTDCVYLLWKYPNEKLVFDGKVDKFNDCKLICEKTTNVLIPSTQPSVSSTPRPEPTQDATANSSRAPAITETIASDNSPDNVALIIGIVCGVLLLVILVIAIGLIYRRHKQTKRRYGNNGVNSSRTDINCKDSDAQRSCSKTSNVSNIPDGLSALPYLGHAIKMNEESEDGYYTINNTNELNRYEISLNTVSSTTSNINDDLNAHEFHMFQNEFTFSPPISNVQGGGDINSEPPCTPEGDYFLLEPENDKDSDPEKDHGSMGCGYSLAKDVINTEMSMIDVIDVSSPPKNIYARFGNNATDKMNPYDMLRRPQGI
ncbi:hypothetical protein BsWGS_25363 [Bradybaena similaris]